VTGEALSVLNAHPWPGNVRQLENAVFRAVVLAEGDEVGAAEFPQLALHAMRPTPAVVPADELPRPAPEAVSSAPLILEEAPAMSPHASEARGGASADALTLVDAAGNVRPLDEIEAEVIRFAIARYRGQMSEVARRLKIGRSTLYRKLEEIGIGAEKSGSAPENVNENVASG
jgi:DNA-binding NtrC family response regulator